VCALTGSAQVVMPKEPKPTTRGVKPNLIVCCDLRARRMARSIHYVLPRIELELERQRDLTDERPLNGLNMLHDSGPCFAGV
jgi:hypothetical protein